MTKIACTLMLMVVSLGYLAGNGTLEDAISAHRSGDISKSLKIYSNLETEGLGGKGLYANMATAYAHQQKDAMAILYYEKALLFCPSDAEILAALTAIRKKNPDLPERDAGSVITKMWNTLTGSFMPNTWAWIFLLLVAIGGVLAVKYHPLKMSQKTGIALTVWSLVVLGTLAAAIQTHSRVYHGRDWIVTEDQAVLRKGPDPDSPEISLLPPGMKLTESDKLSSWLQVTSEYGDAGWIEVTRVRKI